MRVLHVLEAVEGGVALHVQTIAAAQVDSGHEVAVAAPHARAWGLTDPAFSSAIAQSGAQALAVPIHQLPVHLRNTAAARSLRRAIASWGPTIVHSHSTAAGAIARPIARSMGVPTVHTPNGVRFSDRRRTFAGTAELALERVLAPCTSVVVAVSPSELEILSRAHPKGRVVLVPNGVAVSPAPPAPLPSRPRVVFVARLTYQKAPELSVRIFAEVRRRRPNVETVVVGGGAQVARVAELIARTDPEIRLMSGAVGRDEIRRSTVLLLSSRWEGAPYVILEAMEQARPVVATDVVGSRDVVRDGVTGYLFPFGDVDSAASRVVELIDHQHRTREMGAAGRLLLETCFTLEEMRRTLDDVYAMAVRAAHRDQ